MELFLVRHGRSTWNCEGRIQGHRNPELSLDGRRACRKLARGIRSRFGPFSKKTDVLISSSLRRARQTAEVLSETLGLPVQTRTNLREACLGEWEGKTVGEIRRNDRKRLVQWYRDPTRVRLKGAESIGAFEKRVTREMGMLLSKHKNAGNILIVTHGGWISTLLTSVVGIPLARMWTFVLDNASLTRLHWDGKKLYLRSFNEMSSRTFKSIRLA